MKNTSMTHLIREYIRIYLSHNNHKKELYKKELYNFLKNRGGVYNKFLQVLCITKKFMDGWGTPSDYKIYNKALEEDINIFEFVDKNKFKYIEEKPFGIGSFAQVYRGITLNDEEVAIKILKPSVKKNLRSDLRSLKRIVSLVSLFLKTSIIDIKEAFNEFSETCLIETDYQREIDNIDYFYDLYKDHPYIKIPKIYHSLSTEYAITEEYIHGITLASLLIDYNEEESIYDASMRLTGSNLWLQLSIVGGEALRTAMTENFIYGDPHPGNIILLPNNQISFIDFGIVASKPLSQRAFYDWTKSYYNILISNRDTNNFYDIINTTCQCFCPDFLNALNTCTDNKIISIIAGAVSDKINVIKVNNQEVDDLMNDGHMLSIFTSFMNNKNVFQLSMDMRNFSLLKAMQAFICTLNTLDTKYKTHNYTKLMILSMEYAFEAVKNKSIPFDYVSTSKYSKGDSFELIDNILSSLAEGDEFIFQNIYKEMF